MTRAGICGFGLAGRYFHAPLLTAVGIDIQGVVSRQRDHVHSVLPRTHVYERDIDLLANPEIDLVV
ncbi:MAG TPA: hypothetical protein VNA21_04970, partial [Steroidobacteraceae bacterium]|nr:hypothetical protein [Steroidobacteraceae bacterium]